MTRPRTQGRGYVSEMPAGEEPARTWPVRPCVSDECVCVWAVVSVLCAPGEVAPAKACESSGPGRGDALLGIPLCTWATRGSGVRPELPPALFSCVSGSETGLQPCGTAGLSPLPLNLPQGLKLHRLSRLKSPGVHVCVRVGVPSIRLAPCPPATGPLFPAMAKSVGVWPPHS